MRHYTEYAMRGYGALGANDQLTFDAAQMWHDQVAAAKGDPKANDRWGKTMQLALNAVQKAGLPVTGYYGPQSAAAWKRFCNEHGIPYNESSQRPSDQGQLEVLQNALNPGGSGPAAVPGASVTPSGTVVPAQPGDKSASTPEEKPKTAGLGTGGMIAIGVGVVAILGLIALGAKKKPSPASATPNRRRRRSRRHHGRRHAR